MPSESAPPASLDPHAPPLPGRAVIRQRWSDIVFLHWRVDPATVAPMLPRGTRPDVDANGDAWVGLIPFVLSEHAFLPLPPVPGLGTFIEINVRTYSVDAAGNRGVVFQSLDAEQLPSVLAARALFGLPYQWMHADRRLDATMIEYRGRRRTGARPTTRIHARPGTTPVDTELSRFLTARWGFHERHLGRTIYARNTHEPWPLVDAELLHLDDQLLAAAGFPDLAARAPDSVLAMPLGHPGVVTEFAAARRVAVSIASAASSPLGRAPRSVAQYPSQTPESKELREQSREHVLGLGSLVGESPAAGDRPRRVRVGGQKWPPTAAPSAAVSPEHAY